jgi:hypothetical protein
MSKPFYLKSLEDLERDAAGNDPRALYVLAGVIEAGFRGAEPDPERAAELEQRAAKLGLARAARSLGDRAMADDDEAEARRWWKRGAELGDAGSMANLLDDLDSDDPAARAEAEGWLKRAAALGQPYAVDQLEQRTTGVRRPEISVEQLANMSLEEMAALGGEPTGDELDLAFEVEADHEAINHLVGRFVDFLDRRWGAVDVVAEIDGEPFDFPSPAPDEIEDEMIDLTLQAGERHLQMSVSTWDEGEWDLELASFEPHPSREEQAAIAEELRRLADDLGLELRSPATN